MAPREIEIEIDDAAALTADIENARKEDRALVWVTDRQGTKHGLAADKIAFVEIEAEEPKTVGFSSA
jgi:hypothetical protein